MLSVFERGTDAFFQPGPICWLHSTLSASHPSLVHKCSFAEQIIKTFQIIDYRGTFSHCSTASRGKGQLASHLAETKTLRPDIRCWGVPHINSWSTCRVYRVYRVWSQLHYKFPLESFIVICGAPHSASVLPFSSFFLNCESTISSIIIYCCI